MPSYLGGSITVRLCTAELEKTATDTPWNHVGPEPTNHLKKIESVFTEEAIRSSLREHVIHRDGDIPTGLRFIGPQQDMPFFLMKAGPRPLRSNTVSFSRPSVPVSSKNWNPHALDGLRFRSSQGSRAEISKPDATSAANLRSTSEKTFLHTHLAEDSERVEITSSKIVYGDGAIITSGSDSVNIQETVGNDQMMRVKQGLNTQAKARAFCVVVDMATPAFLSLPRSITDIHGSRRALDLKIDVFYNGSFENSAYISERVRKSNRNLGLTVLFHGRRIGRLVERPWILLPHTEHNEYNVQQGQRVESQRAVTEEIWSAVNELLREHAETLGRDHSNKLTLLGCYLEALSSLSMPVQLVQRRGSPQYGILDVVISVGRGRKDDARAQYNTEPIPMRLSELRTTRAHGDARELGSPKKEDLQSARTSSSPSPRKIYDRQAASLTPRINMNNVPHRNHHMYNTQLAGAASIAGTTDILHDGKAQDPTAGEHAMETDAVPKVLSASDASTIASASSIHPSSSTKEPMAKEDLSYLSPTRAGPVTSSESERAGPSKLVHDCVMTHAEDKVRQVRSERSGQFYEWGILLGVRYLVG